MNVDVKHIAALARLHLSEAEASELGAQLGSILEHMSALAGVDVEGVGPMRGALDRAAPPRPDVPAADPLLRATEEMAPAWEEGFFLVPRLAALDPEAG